MGVSDGAGGSEVLMGRCVLHGESCRGEISVGTLLHPHTSTLHIHPHFPPSLPPGHGLQGGVSQ